MKSVSLSGRLRSGVGKKDAKAVREEGRVPCILYGGAEQISFSLSERDLTHVIYTPHVYQISLDIEGKTYHSIIKDLQFHNVSDRLQHIDFLELIPGKQITMEIPVKVTGNSIGVRQGGKLIVNVRKLKVKALPENLPDTIDIAVDDLDIGQYVKVGALKVANIEILDEPNKVVTSVRTTRAAQAAAQASSAEEKKKK